MLLLLLRKVQVRLIVPMGTNYMIFFKEDHRRLSHCVTNQQFELWVQQRQISLSILSVCSVLTVGMKHFESTGRTHIGLIGLDAQVDLTFHCG